MFDRLAQLRFKIKFAVILCTLLPQFASVVQISFSFPRLFQLQQFRVCVKSIDRMAGDGGWKNADDKIRLKENKSQTVFIEYRPEKVRRFIFSSITKHFYNTSGKGLSSKKKRVDFYYIKCLQYRKHELSEKNQWKSQPISSPPTLSWQQV